MRKISHSLRVFEKQNISVGENRWINSLLAQLSPKKPDKYYQLRGYYVII